MPIMNDPNLWVIGGLLFLLGLLIGMFMTAGGRRKWKTRYHDEIGRREALERSLKEREADWAARDKQRELELTEREKTWREQDSLRAAAIKGRGKAGAAPVADPIVDRDLDRDGVPDDLDRRPADDRKA